MRTQDGVTTAPDVHLTFFVFMVLYLGLGATLVFLLRYLATGAPVSARRPSVGEVPGAA
jgi:cytochrome bd-type quinol oxidase subunit 1